MLSNTILALTFLPFALAHFELNHPPTRGFDDDKEGNFPCGSFDTVSQNRTDFPISGGPIQLTLGHPQTNVAVYMAIGDNPGTGFSIVAKKQFTVEGLGDFCIGSVAVPEGVSVSSGTKASIQVVTNAHGEGGLYQCTDVTLVSKQLSQSEFSDNCKNNTGVKVTQENISGNPNGTSTSTEPSTSTSGQASSPKATGAATQAKAASWVLGAVGLAGLALL